MATKNGLDDLLNTHFFRNADLKKDDIAILDRLGFQQKSYPPHTDILREGYADMRVLIIHSGWSCLYRTMPDGDRQIFDFALGGDIIGMRGSSAPIRRSFRSMTTLAVFEVSSRCLLNAIGPSVCLIDLFLSGEARHKAILAEHLANVGRRSALARTAHILLELSTRLQSVGLADAKGFECPLTQHDLADALGLTAIHINRMLRELRERDLVSFHKGRIDFINRDACIRLSDFDSAYAQRWPDRTRP